jgi:hypothetical protein
MYLHGRLTTNAIRFSLPTAALLLAAGIAIAQEEQTMISAFEVRHLG